MHGTASAINFEAVSNESERVKGVLHSEKLPRGLWSLNAGGPFIASTSNIVGFKASMTDAMALVWDAGADSSDIATCSWMTDGHFRGIGGNDGYPGDNDGPDLKLLVLARKLDTTGSAGDNTDLALTADMKWLWSDPDEAVGDRTGDTALNSLTTKASVTLDALAAGSVEQAYHWYELDLGARLEAETKVLKPYSFVQFNLAPQETVGTALNIEVLSVLVEYRRHTAVTPRTRRV